MTMTTAQRAKKKECQKLLKMHGLGLKWFNGFSYAEKLIAGAMISVRKKGDQFTITVRGKGTCRKYFEREAAVLMKSLMKYGTVTVDLI